MERLGRRVAIDERDHHYPMRTLLPEASDRRYRYWWANGLWADQGATGTCVGHAWAHYVEDGPVTWSGEVDPITIYIGATHRDSWPENDGGDLNFGTSVRAGADYLRDAGRISEYRWAWDLTTVQLALLEEGPVVVGTWWLGDMFTPDPGGFLSVTGGVVGGHAYLLNGINLDHGKVRVKNSWGRDWGRRGHAWMRLDDLGVLLADSGEACLAVEGKAAS